MEPTRFRGRTLASLLALASLLVLALSGLILFLAPRGRAVRADGWEWLGLTRWQWADLHVAFGVLMLAAAIPHIWANRRALLNHLRRRAAVTAKRWPSLRPEFLVAAALCTIVLVGAVWRVPPIGAILDLRSGGYAVHRPALEPNTGTGPEWRHPETPRR